VGGMVGILYTLAIGILGIVTGILIVLVLYLLIQKLNRKNRLAERLKRLYREGPKVEKRVIILDPYTILRLSESWVMESDLLEPEQVYALERVGFAKKIGNIIIANIDAIGAYINRIRNIQLPRSDTIVTDYNDRLAAYGIISITFFGVDSQIGPVFKYTTALTKLTRRLMEDQETRDNLFILSGRVDELILEGSRVLIHEISGGERGIEGYVIVELSKDADIEKVKTRIARIDKIPSSTEETRKYLEKL